MIYSFRKSNLIMDVNFVLRYYYSTSVPVPSKMMALKKKHLIFYCHFIYFTFISFSEKKILKIKLLLAIRKLDTGFPIITRR